MEEYQKFKLSLRILSDRIDVDTLESAIGLSHSSFVPRGRKIVPSIPESARDIWIRKLAECEGDDLTETIGSVCALLRPRELGLASIKDLFGYESQFYLSFHSSLAQGTFCLPPLLMEILANARLALHVSILSWGEISKHDGEKLEKGSSEEKKT